jgi:hypothetical protein
MDSFSDVCELNIFMHVVYTNITGQQIPWPFILYSDAGWTVCLHYLIPQDFPQSAYHAYLYIKAETLCPATQDCFAWYILYVLIFCRLRE